MPESSCSASVSTLAKVISGWPLEASSKIGPKVLQGPHHSAQKSTSVMPSLFTVASKSAWTKFIVANLINHLYYSLPLGRLCQNDTYNNHHTPEGLGQANQLPKPQ